MKYLESKNKNIKSGFSLLELVMALSFFAIGSLVAGLMIIDANTSTLQNIYKSEALLVAREGIEAVMFIRDLNFCNLYDATSTPNGLSNPTDESWVFSGTQDVVDGKYLRQVFITMDDNTSNTFTSTSTATVEVVVKWINPRTDQSDYTDQVSLSTILSNWRFSDDVDGNEQVLTCD
jgi:prepilin-type N-terminal cleavage/methylation domain-containing protein